MTLKILQFIETKGPGGAEKVYLDLVNGMLERGYDVHAALTGSGWVKDKLENMGVKPVIFNTKGSFDIKLLANMIKYTKMKKIGLIHSHLLGANLYSSLTGILTKVHVISTFHGPKDFESAKDGKLFMIKGKIIQKGSKFIVVVSNYLKNILYKKKWIKPDKIHTIYNGIDISLYKREYREEIRNNLGINKENILIGQIGNIRPMKGHEYFIRAAAIVNKIYPSTRFLIAGDSSKKDKEYLNELTKVLGIKNHTIFTGFREDIQNILASLDIFVNASIYEGFSIATVEAMATGIPVICTKSGGPEEIVINEKNGLLVPTKDPESIAKAICNIISNKELAVRLTKEGLKTAKKFTIEAMIKNYESLYSNYPLKNLNQDSRGNDI